MAQEVQEEKTQQKKKEKEQSQSGQRKQEEKTRKRQREASTQTRAGAAADAAAPRRVIRIPSSPSPRRQASKNAVKNRTVIATEAHRVIQAAQKVKSSGIPLAAKALRVQKLHEDWLQLQAEMEEEEAEQQ